MFLRFNKPNLKQLAKSIYRNAIYDGINWRQLAISDLIQIPVLLLFSMLVFLSGQWIIIGSMKKTLDFVRVTPTQALLTVGFIFISTLIIFALTRRSYYSVLITGLFFDLAYTICIIKSTLRNEPLLPWDLASAGEAADIAGHVDLHIPYESIVLFIVTILITAVLFIFRNRFLYTKIKYAVRGVFTLIFVLAILFYTRSTFMNYPFTKSVQIMEYQFDQMLNMEKNGWLFSFLMNLKYVNVKKSASYNKQTIDSDVKQIKKLPSSNAKPNIIVIQSEAFCDLSRFQNVKFPDNVMSTVKNLQNNYISGYTLTPQFGGGTCNSEFEVLTGLSCSYFAPGSLPYQQYIKRPTFSYADFLKNIGYDPIAVHSYKRTYFNRNAVYNFFGFNKFIAMDNFVNPEHKRTYISDLSTMKMIIQQYEQNQKTGKPFFNFTVTMQNHASWSKNDYPASELVPIDAPGMTETQKDMLQSYATGVYEADQALKYLIDYFSAQKNPTIVVFYGDHLPALDKQTYVTGKYITGSLNDVDSIYKLYTTPYVIWNNFGQKSVPHEDMSMYELMPYMTKVFNLPRPLYFDYLLEQYDHYHGNAQGLSITPSGTVQKSLPADGKKYYSEQYMLEYDMLFGKEYGKALTK